MQSNPYESFLRKHRPDLADANDALVLAIHSEFLANGCSLKGLDEDQPEADMSDLPHNWKGSTPGIYSFVYRKGSTKIIFKCVVVDDSLSVNGQIDGSSQIVSIDIRAEDHVKADSLDSIGDVFRDEQALRKIIREQLVTSLGLIKEQQTGNNSNRQQQNRYHPYDPVRGGDPLRVGGPRRPMPQRGGDFGGDLGPFGPGGFGQPGQPGNLMGPGHGAFGPRGIGGRPGMPGRGLPPGARYDPTNPFGGDMGPSPDHMGFPGVPGRRGGRGGPPGSPFI